MAARRSAASRAISGWANRSLATPSRGWPRQPPRGEAVGVELARFDLQPVPAALRDEAVEAEGFAQHRHVALECLVRGRWGRLAPQCLDQSICWQQLVRVEQERGEERPGLGAARRDVDRPLQRLQPSQDPEVHASFALRRRILARVTSPMTGT